MAQRSKDNMAESNSAIQPEAEGVDEIEKLLDAADDPFAQSRGRINAELPVMNASNVSMNQVAEPEEE